MQNIHTKGFSHKNLNKDSVSANKFDVSYGTAFISSMVISYIVLHIKNSLAGNHQITLPLGHTLQPGKTFLGLSEGKAG